MEGLATYQILKTGFMLLIIIIFFGLAVWLVFHNISLNYLSTPICNITNVDENAKKQKLVYNVNSKEYVKDIEPRSNLDTKTNVTTYSYAYPTGQCTLYYPSANPDSFSVNSNPTTVSFIMAGILLIITILGVIWFLFLRSNKDFAGVIGGIDVADSLITRIRRPY